MQIFRCCHDCELNGTLIAKNLVGPFSDGTDLFDSSNTVVGNEDLEQNRASASQYLNFSFSFFFFFFGLWQGIRGDTNRRNDRMPFMLGDEIPHFTGNGEIETIATDEMRR